MPTDMPKNTDPWPSIGNLAAHVTDPFRKKDGVGRGGEPGPFEAFEKMDGTNVGLRAFGPSTGQLLGRNYAILADAPKYQGVDLERLRDPATLAAARALVAALLEGTGPGPDTSAVVYGELIVGDKHGYGKRPPPRTVAKGDWFVFGVVFGGAGAGPALRDGLRDAGYVARFAADADGRHSVAVFLNARLARLVEEVGAPSLRTPPPVGGSSYASLPELVLALEPAMAGNAAGLLEGVVVTSAASGFVAKWKVGRVDDSMGVERIAAMRGDGDDLSPRTAALVAALERVAGRDRAAPAAARNEAKRGKEKEKEKKGGDRDFALAFDSAASKIDSLSTFRARGCLKEAVEFLASEVAKDYAAAGRPDAVDAVEAAVKREVGRRLKTSGA